MKKIGYIITRNGKSNHLPKTLSNMENFLDYLLVMVSRKSNDGTYPYVKNHSAVDKVLVEDAEFPLHEPRIRKRAYAYAKIDNPDADILLAIDDDEIIPDTEKDLANDMFKFALEKEIDVVCAEKHHLWDENKIRVDYSWNPERCRARIVENLNAENQIGDWARRGPHSGRLPLEQFEGKETGAFPLLHFGWKMSEEQQQQKMQRKIKEDYRNILNMSLAQQIHYKSFHEEPVLEPIPEKWEQHL